MAGRATELRRGGERSGESDVVVLVLGDLVGVLLRGLSAAKLTWVTAGTVVVPAPVPASVRRDRSRWRRRGSTRPRGIRG